MFRTGDSNVPLTVVVIVVVPLQLYARFFKKKKKKKQGLNGDLCSGLEIETIRSQVAFFFFHCTCRHALVTYAPYRRFKRPVDSCCCYSCCFHCNCTLQLYACFFKKSKGSMVTYVPDWRLKWPVDSCCCYCCCFHCSCTHVSLQRARAKR